MSGSYPWLIPFALVWGAVFVVVWVMWRRERSHRAALFLGGLGLWALWPIVGWRGTIGLMLILWGARVSIDIRRLAP